MKVDVRKLVGVFCLIVVLINVAIACTYLSGEWWSAIVAGILAMFITNFFIKKDWI